MFHYKTLYLGKKESISFQQLVYVSIVKVSVSVIHELYTNVINVLGTGTISAWN